MIVRKIRSLTSLSFLVLACAALLVGQNRKIVPPPIVPLSVNGSSWEIANDIEFEIDLGSKKGALTIYAPGWLDWTVAATEDSLEIGSLTAAAAAKLALLRTFMTGWVESTENTGQAARILFAENIRFEHRRNGNRIVVDLEKLAGKPKRRKKKK